MRNSQWAAALVVVLLVIIVAAAAAAPLAQMRSRFSLRGARLRLSGVDGQRYRVHGGHADPGGAADTMATINRRTVRLLRFLRARYVRGRAAGARFPARAHATERLLARYNPDNLAENSPRDPSGDTSYTIGKGDILAICLRERSAGRSGDPAVHDIHETNTLMFVMVHELTHIAILEVDHPPRFWEAFKFLLTEAQEAGVLDNTDYARRPEEYCGMTIDYNPYFDRGLRAIA